MSANHGVKTNLSGELACSHPKILGPGITFDDVLLVPRMSTGLPAQASVQTLLTRNIPINLPLVSAPMDRVTESAMAAALAALGGIGIIHRNLPIKQECAEVAKVKLAHMHREGEYPAACVDAQGRLRVGAAAGTLDFDRVEALVAAGADVVVIDTAHGHSANVRDTVVEIKKRHRIEVIAGNVGTAEGAAFLVEAGADAVKVGMGPGSICTTRIVSGVGVPQITAILGAVEGVADAGVPIIADGGIVHSGDITKALAAGAHCVMLGSLLAGLDESPGKCIDIGGRCFKEYRGMGSRAAMQAGSADRYAQNTGADARKWVPEGVEGLVPYRGALVETVRQLIGGLKAGMGYCGAESIEELRRDARFYWVTPAGKAESHPHDIIVQESQPDERNPEARGSATS